MRFMLCLDLGDEEQIGLGENKRQKEAAPPGHQSVSQRVARPPAGELNSVNIRCDGDLQMK